MKKNRTRALQVARIYARLPDGREIVSEKLLTAVDAAALKRGDDPVREDRMRTLMLALLARHGLPSEPRDLPRTITQWGFSIEERVVAELGPGDAATPPNSRLDRCRSLLGAAAGLLPASERDDALDEWIDEIETAAALGHPIRRRTCSIVLRSLPVLALRARVPRRAPRKGG